MSITIGKYTADGVFLNADSLKNQSGVYVILGRNGDAERWNVIDVGESEGVRDRVKTHDRVPCWDRQRYRQRGYAAIYCGAADRMRIESELRQQFNPPCGKV